MLPEPSASSTDESSHTSFLHSFEDSCWWFQPPLPAQRLTSHRRWILYDNRSEASLSDAGLLQYEHSPNVYRWLPRLEEFDERRIGLIIAIAFHEIESRNVYVTQSVDPSPSAQWHSPICSFQSSGFSIKPSLQQYVHGTRSRSTALAPERAVSGSRPSVPVRNKLMTSPRPCHVLTRSA
jgi:hypothetical protein